MFIFTSLQSFPATNRTPCMYKAMKENVERVVMENGIEEKLQYFAFTVHTKKGNS